MSHPIEVQRRPKRQAPLPPMTISLKHEDDTLPNSQNANSPSLKVLEQRTPGLVPGSTSQDHSHPQSPLPSPTKPKLYRVLLSSCVSLALILLLLLFLTSTSESASLTSTSSASTSKSNQNPTSNINPNHHNLNYNYHYSYNENNRLPSNSYAFRIPYPPYANPPYQQNQNQRSPRQSRPQEPRPTPRVIVRLSSESGILRHQHQNFQSPSQAQTLQHFMPSTHAKIQLHASQNSPEENDKSSGSQAFDQENDAEKSLGPLGAQDQEDYPYQFYLDYEQKSPKSPELLPLPSETFKPEPHLQNNIWSDFLSHQLTTTPTPPSPEVPSIFNEIDNFDNYTIPSLRDYKFPEFKTPTTSKPYSFNNNNKKQDYLNPYEFFSEEDLENVADLEGDHSKYFVKTKPRDVSSSVANLYNSFYYEPPSYSTKTQPLPVKAKFPSGQRHINSHEDFNEVENFDQNSNNYENDDDDDQLVTVPETTTPMSTSTQASSTTTTTTTSHAPSTRSTTQTGTYDQVPTALAAESILSSRSVDHHQLKNLQKTPNLNIIPDIPASTNPLFTSPTTTDPGSIPGMPGIDFPIFDEIPVTNFDCQKQRYKGFFADIETKCQAWHYCDFTDGHSTFLCPNGTLFSQVLLTCDWWFNVNCKQAQQLYVLNERLYRYIKPPKPSFPEDYHGPQVDLWLLKQHELGLLPKIKKRGKLIEKDNNRDKATSTTTESINSTSTDKTSE